MPVPFEGGCRCGAIRYRCTAEPIFVVHCHCRDCQYASGGASSTAAIVPYDAVTIEGESASYSVTADSGAQVFRRFCATCGSPLFAGNEKSPAFLAIRAASLDDPSWLIPAADIWMKSAQPWAPLQEGLMRWQANPGEA